MIPLVQIPNKIQKFKGLLRRDVHLFSNNNERMEIAQGYEKYIIYRK